ncbi:MAG: hypothetical protein RIQ93_1746 [Verrucomicrobiota bacterium]|jgi:Fur family ferric uptake transcriptional regulator
MIASTQTNHPFEGEVHTGRKSASALEIASARLKSAGLRITKPRLAILEALNQRAAPSSIEQIHAHVGAENCDLVTVYRCMGAFEEIGLVRRAYFYNGTTLYEINLGNPNRYHLVCKGSNKVIQLEPQLEEELRSTIAAIEEKLRARGFAEVSHIVEFFAAEPRASGRGIETPSPEGAIGGERQAPAQQVWQG